MYDFLFWRVEGSTSRVNSIFWNDGNGWNVKVLYLICVHIMNQLYMDLESRKYTCLLTILIAMNNIQIHS